MLLESCFEDILVSTDILTCMICSINVNFICYFGSIWLELTLLFEVSWADRYQYRLWYFVIRYEFEVLLQWADICQYHLCFQTSRRVPLNLPLLARLGMRELFSNIDDFQKLIIANKTFIRHFIKNDIFFIAI